jgi:hypothetical protein
MKLMVAFLVSASLLLFTGGMASALAETAVDALLVCAGPPGLSVGVTIVVGDITGVLNCDAADRTVRQRFFGVIDRTDPLRVVLTLTLPDGGTGTCDFATSVEVPSFIAVPEKFACAARIYTATLTLTLL